MRRRPAQGVRLARCDLQRIRLLSHGLEVGFRGLGGDRFEHLDFVGKRLRKLRIGRFGKNFFVRIPKQRFGLLRPGIIGIQGDSTTVTKL